MNDRPDWLLIVFVLVLLAAAIFGGGLFNFDPSCYYYMGGCT